MIIMIKKNELHDLAVTDLTYLGAGFAKVASSEPGDKGEGFAVFIDNALPGDVVSTKILKVKKNYAFGKIERILEPSPDRVAAPELYCPVWDKCGGCALLHMDYDAQLDHKREQAITAFANEGLAIDFETISIGDEPFHYRNKAVYPVRAVMDKGNMTQRIGFFKKNSHMVIENFGCAIVQPVNEQILTLIKSHKIVPYDETTGKGNLRHVFIRQAPSTGEIMVALVVNKNTYTPPKSLIESLAKIKGMASIILNVNDQNTNVAIGKVSRLLWGKETIRDTMGHVSFDISLHSFYQVNSEVCADLYQDIVSFAEFKGTENVLDAYCGIGTISLYIAHQVATVQGIEVVSQAVNNATENAVLNNIYNVNFTCDTVENALAVNKSQVDTVILDPSRKGLDPTVIDALLDMSPEKILYVSCNPKTLARDIKALSAQYTITKTKLYDFFPHSLHIESLVMLVKK